MLDEAVIRNPMLLKEIRRSAFICAKLEASIDPAGLGVPFPLVAARAIMVHSYGNGI